MPKKLISLFLILILVFSLAACSDTEKNNGDSSADKSNSKNGGTIKLACVSIDTMNPIITQHASVSDFLSLVYEGLFSLNPDLTVEPVLAESFEVSSNNTVYTIKLKNNIKFHNGKAFTADDVVATLDYMSFYSTRYSSFMQYVAGYYAENSHTLVINLNSSKTDFANNLDFPILPKGLMADDFAPENPDFVPVGTGMYQYDTTVAYKNIVLKAYEGWRGGLDRAYIDKVDIEILSDENTIISAFDAGAIDAMSTSWRGYGELSLASTVFNTFENEQNRFTFVGINCHNYHFDSAKERRRLKDSIDAEKITEDIMLGHGVVATSPVRDGTYYNVKNTNTSEQIGTDRHDKTDTAPVECRLLYNSESKTKQRVAVAVKQQLEAAGYSIILDGQPYALYADKIALADYDLYIGEVKLGGSCDMQFMFSSPMSGICNYDDSEFRTLVSNLDIVIGSKDKKIAWENFEKYYTSSVPQVPLYFTNEASFINKRISGDLKPGLSTPYYGLDDMYIPKQKS